MGVLRRIRTLTGPMLVLCLFAIIAANLGLSSFQATKTLSSSGLIPGGTYTYFVFKDGIYTVMQDYRTGTEITRSIDATYVINRALNDAANGGGGSILLRNGNYSTNNNILMRSNTALILEAGTIIEATYTAQEVGSLTGEGIIQFLGTGTSARVVNAHIASESGRATIKGKSDSAWEVGIEFRYADRCSAKGLEINNIGGDGVYLRFADQNVLEDLYVHGYGKYCLVGDMAKGVMLHGGNSGNKLINLHVDGENLANASGRGNVAFCMQFNGGWGDVRNNEVNGGIYERSGNSHSIYWCSDNNGVVEGNTAVGGISRGSKNSAYGCGFKLNPARYSYVNWTVYDCSHGIDLGNGGRGGNVGNVIYATITNVTSIGMDFWVQGSTVGQNVEENTVYAYVTGSPFGIYFHNDASAECHIMNNTIHLTTRNIRNNAIQIGDNDLTANNEVKYNDFYVDLEADRYGINWDSSGYGRWNRFIGDWQNVHSDSGNVVIETNYFEGTPTP